MDFIYDETSPTCLRWRVYRKGSGKGKPTPSPLRPTRKVTVNTTPTFGSREAARDYARANGKSLKDLGKTAFPRWTVK